MVIPLQGKRDRMLRSIFYGSITWKCLFHTYRLSKKGVLVYPKILSKELGHNVSNVRKTLSDLESMGFITKTKLQQTEVIYISKIQLTSFGEEIASHIFNIVKSVYKNIEDKETNMEDKTIEISSESKI